MWKRGVVVLALLASACGEDDPVDPETGSVSGTVSGPDGALAGAVVAAAGKTAATENDGSYEIAALNAGTVELSVTADWFVGDAEQVTVPAGGSATADFILAAAALEVEAADATLAAAFNAGADWTTDTVSIAHVSAPTRAGLELALHYRNPALYRDPGGESQVTPSVLPAVATPATFDFEVTSGAQQGAQALDVSTLVDDVADTPYGGTPADGVLLWESALHYLLNGWSFDDTADLFTAGVAVRQQKWGGTGMLPTQEIERVHLHGGDIWVEVVFQDFVDLAGDVTDADNDGLREVWAEINPVHFDATLYAELRDTYVAETHGTLELRDILLENLDALYSQGTDAGVHSAIGVPYTHADLGTVSYPFAVVRHNTLSIDNVFLVAP